MSIRAATWPSGTRVVFRDLTWGEYQKARSHQGSSAERALDVYTLCLIDGPSPNVVTAGIMMWICLEEMEKSPFSGTFRAISLPLAQAREKVTGTFLLSAQAFIASVLRVPFEIMETWDGDTFLTRLAQAEFVSGVPLNPLDPTAPAAPNQKKVGKRPLSPAQQIAVERKNDIRNKSGPRKAGIRSPGQPHV